MSTYGTMQSRIADDIARTDLTSQIRTAILNAIVYYSVERFWFNQGVATAATVDAQQNYDLPSDFIAADSLRITVNSSVYDLFPRTKQYIDQLTVTASHEGQPSDYAIYAEDFWLWPIPDAVYTLTLAYHKKFAVLSASADTNAWMVEAEQLIRNRAEWELYGTLLRDIAMANACKSMELEALANLKNMTGRQVASGTITPQVW